MNTTPNQVLAIELSAINPGMTDAADLYKTYFHHILRMVRRYYPCEEASKDLAMDVFIKILFNLDKFNEKGLGMKPWILKITHNEIMQNFRRNKNKNKKVDADVSELYGIPCEETQEDPMDELITTEWPVIKNILLNMDEKSYKIIHLRFFCRKPYKEIGEMLGITENNAKVKINRILKRIRKEYRFYKLREERRMTA